MSELAVSSWAQAIDQKLLRWLLQPLQSAGVIDSQLPHSILDRLEAMAGRPPLVDRLMLRQSPVSQAQELPIVYSTPSPAPVSESSLAPRDKKQNKIDKENNPVSDASHRTSAILNDATPFQKQFAAQTTPSSKVVQAKFTVPDLTHRALSVNPTAFIHTHPIPNPASVQTGTRAESQQSQSNVFKESLSKISSPQNSISPSGETPIVAGRISTNTSTILRQPSAHTYHSSKGKSLTSRPHQGTSNQLSPLTSPLGNTTSNQSHDHRPNPPSARPLVYPSPIQSSTESSIPRITISPTETTASRLPKAKPILHRMASLPAPAEAVDSPIRVTETPRELIPASSHGLSFQSSTVLQQPSSPQPTAIRTSTQHNSASTHSTSSLSSPALSMTPQSPELSPQPPKVDIERLTDKVERKLRRRLRMEQELKGL